MNFLFIHQNLPAQFRHLAAALAAQPGHRVVFLTQHVRAHLPGVEVVRYRPAPAGPDRGHGYLSGTQAHLRNAHAVADAARQLQRNGFVPDLMVGHNGWGEIWFLKDVFPRAPLLGYFEFFYTFATSDVGFDPAVVPTAGAASRIRMQNTGNLLGLEAADHGLCPTYWQKSVYPARYAPMLDVIHEGIDTAHVRPIPQVRVAVGEHGLTLGEGDEVVTYVARNLEPFRGFPTFMRSLPALLARRPRAHVLIVGGDEVSYGGPLPGGDTWRARMLREVGPGLDPARVHFLGRLPYAAYLRVLQIARVHVYLTYPFVLSWSMLEAMACGCAVLGSRTGPVEEVITDGVNGMLVDFFDPAALAARIADALQYGDDLAPLRHAARATVRERYDLRTVCLPAQLALIARLTGHGG